MYPDWPRLIAERNEWVAHNFPDQGSTPGEASCLGMIEELGELTHAHLKEAQGIRGTAEEHQANARDAVGDYTIYALGVMNAWSCHPSSFNNGHVYIPDATKTLLSLAYATGQVTQIVASGGPRAPEKLTRAIHYVRKYAELRGWDYTEIVHETWAKVSQRDWVADPLSGGE